MTFKDFLNKYNGKSNVGNTTENIGQCVGLVSVWVDVLGLPHIWGNACDLFVNADSKFFDQILNTPDAIPQAGDIIIWTKYFNGSVGHTGIATGTGDLNTFECFEQNDPLGSNCHLKTYNYNFVIGWLRPKQIVVDNNVSVDKTIFENLVRKSTSWDHTYQKLNLPDNEGLVMGELDKLIGYEDMVVQKDKQINDAAGKISDLETRLKTLSDQNSQLQQNITVLDDQKQTLSNDLDAQKKVVNQAQTEIETLKTDLKNVNTQLNIPMFTGWKKLIYDFLVKF